MKRKDKKQIRFLLTGSLILIILVSLFFIIGLDSQTAYTKSVECVYNSDCGTNQVCDTLLYKCVNVASGTITCAHNQVLVNNVCIDNYSLGNHGINFINIFIFIIIIMTLLYFIFKYFKRKKLI